MTSHAAVVGGTGVGPDAVDVPARMVRQMAKTGGRDKPILRVRAAGFPRRLAAAFVDFSLVTAASTAVTAVAALALGVQLPSAKEFGPDFVMAGLLDRNPMVAGGLGLLLGMSALYQIYLGGVLGQTLGKRLFRLRVISSQGQAPGPVVACARFISLALSLALVGLGFVWCLFDRERRALHDHLSGTYVILDER
ncbi:MAG: RDD family protein [Deltaproteobacteria bacterium]|nr:RDD family protein [Deltaproteobacteria bacterium]